MGGYKLACMLYEDYLYARISEDEVALEKGVTRQLREGRDLSSKRGGTVIAEYSDNDVSALKGAPRPGFDRLMSAVAAPNPHGRQRRIIVVHTSRLWRNREERAAGITTLGRLGVIVLPVNGPELHLSSAAGRMVAGMLGEVDTGESETKAERIQSAAIERAQEGRANGPCLYGWTRHYEYDSKGRIVGFRDEENTVEADVVREVVDRLLGGWSLIAVTSDLNRRGIPAPGAGHNRARRAKGQASDGSKWGKTSVKKLATRPANVGLRVFHRGRPDQALLPAAWPKIVDPDKHDRVVALLSDPARRTNHERPGQRNHLLTSGIGECGICDGHLRVAWKGNAKYGKYRLYTCEANECVARNEQAVDRLVDHHMIALLQRPDVADLLTGSAKEAANLLSRAEALKTRLASAAAAFAEEQITAEQLSIITGKLKPQLDAAEAAARAARPSPHLELVMSATGPLAAEKWHAMQITQKRAVMTAFRTRVVILPTRRGRGFDPRSVRIEPIHAGGQAGTGSPAPTQWSAEDVTASAAVVHHVDNVGDGVVGGGVTA
jgi:site-specific DNA recombinase